MKKKFVIFAICVCALFSQLFVGQITFAYSPVKKNTYSCDYSILKRYNDPVIYNAKSHIYHETWCEWALKSTENGYYMERKEAQMKGRHCKVCY